VAHALLRERLQCCWGAPSYRLQLPSTPEDTSPSSWLLSVKTHQAGLSKRGVGVGTATGEMEAVEEIGGVFFPLEMGQIWEVGTVPWGTSDGSEKQVLCDKALDLGKDASNSPNPPTPQR
jgi:hypothetical protein